MRISDWSSDVCSSDLNSLTANATLETFPNQRVIFQYFANQQCDGGFASGDMYLGEVMVFADSNGVAEASFTFDTNSKALSAEGEMVPLRAADRKLVV